MSRILRLTLLSMCICITSSLAQPAPPGAGEVPKVLVTISSAKQDGAFMRITAKGTYFVPATRKLKTFQLIVQDDAKVEVSTTDVVKVAAEWGSISKTLEAGKYRVFAKLTHTDLMDKDQKDTPSEVIQDVEVK